MFWCTGVNLLKLENKLLPPIHQFVVAENQTYNCPDRKSLWTNEFCCRLKIPRRLFGEECFGDGIDDEEWWPIDQIGLTFIHPASTDSPSSPVIYSNFWYQFVDDLDLRQTTKTISLVQISLMLDREFWRKGYVEWWNSGACSLPRLSRMFIVAEIDLENRRKKFGLKLGLNKMRWPNSNKNNNNNNNNKAQLF